LVVGNGSNLLVSERGFDGIALVLGGEFATLEWHPVDGGFTVHAGAALDLPVTARRLTEAGVAGFEWAVGVPGTVGGAVAMNAGGHGSDVAATLLEAEIFDVARAAATTVPASRLRFRYRSSAVGEGQIVLRATFGLGRGDPAAGRSQIAEIVRWRREHQPGGANAGSVFKNPLGQAAGALIDAAGLKGLRVGTAQVSEKHANFIQLDADGRADDVKDLIDEVRRRVRDHSGVSLETEVRLIGFDGGAP
jgi:UDP-N-acetylmuramate dehydrogenase